MRIKSVKMKISKNKKNNSFSCPKDPSTLLPIHSWTLDRQTDRQTEWLPRAPFQGFRIFSFNIIKDRPKNILFVSIKTVNRLFFYVSWYNIYQICCDVKYETFVVKRVSSFLSEPRTLKWNWPVFEMTFVRNDIEWRANGNCTIFCNLNIF